MTKNVNANKWGLKCVRDTGTNNQVHPSLADVRTECKHDIRVLPRFDLLSAVMSLVVKLLLNFNIVYRQWHLPTEILIYPFLRRTA